MVVLNIAVIASDELARSIAKAADQRDVHTYVHKENGPEGARILSLIRPAKYPERLPPFLNALSTSQAGIIEVTAVDASLGEVLVAFASAGIKRGLAVINPAEGGWVDEDQVKMLFKQAGLASWTFEANDGSPPRTYVCTDGRYPRRVGSQRKGTARSPGRPAFQRQRHWLGGHWLRSVGQRQRPRRGHALAGQRDGQCKITAGDGRRRRRRHGGDRVGLALRNAKEDHLTGGTIIVHPPVEDKRANLSVPLAVEQHQSSSVQLTTSPFQKRVLAKGDVVHASVDLQFVVGRVASVDGQSLSVDWEQPLFIRKDNPPSVLIAQLDSKPRIMGSAVLVQNDG